MSVDLNLKVQVRENNAWKTIEVNEHSHTSWCGRWLYSLLFQSSLSNRGLPSDYDGPEEGYGFTYFTIDELHSFLDGKLNDFFQQLRVVLDNGRLARIEGMLKRLLGENAEEIEDYSEEDYSYMVEDEVWDIVSGFKIIGYIQYLKGIYEGYEYISDDNIRAILWYD